ncbi:MAG TPA: glycerol-3-phosphate 1-O-acyltransferase PlsY [Candidatus Binataceae bacterium]
MVESLLVESLSVAAAYLIGSIPVGVIVGRVRGFDPRAVGSGNIGMSNVARAGGSGAAAMTFAGDLLKGAVPVAIARAAGFDGPGVAWVALAAFVGSICSIFLGFHGGKGVSAALGIWIVIAPLAIVFALAAFGVAFALSRIMSVASMTAAIALIPAVAALGMPRPYLLLAIAMTALVLFRHHENIRRLARGEEPKFKPKPREGVG